VTESEYDDLLPEGARVYSPLMGTHGRVIRHVRRPVGGLIDYQVLFEGIHGGTHERVITREHLRLALIEMIGELHEKHGDL